MLEESVARELPQVTIFAQLTDSAHLNLYISGKETNMWAVGQHQTGHKDWLSTSSPATTRSREFARAQKAKVLKPENKKLEH